METRIYLFGLILLAGLGYFALEHSTRAASRVLPFQGQLKDAQGNPLPDGAKVVQFKIYDAPVGGQAVWNGEVQKLSINGGLVSTLLGTKANLSAVDFNRDLYLELTIDANNDTQITAADPPLLPRQSILPTVFAIEAADSRKLAGEDWTPLFGTNSPAGWLLDSKIRDGSINAAKLQPGTISSNQIAPLTLHAGLVVDGTLTSNQIANGAIDFSDLSQQIIEALNPPGTVQAFAGPNTPPGWLLCDGSALDKDNPAYSRLFAAISTSWGNGSASGSGALFPSVRGTTDFNIPDLRGRFLRGVSHLTDTDPDRDARTSAIAGGNRGNSVGSLQSSRIGDHTHGGGAGSANGNLTAQIYNSANGNTWIRHRSIPEWIANDNGNLGELSRNFSNPATRGAVVVGRTSDNNPETTETRPINAYVHYIIKL